MVLRQPAHLSPIASSHSPETPYLVQWLQSGGNLDFVVLALCSCVLTVFCHQTTVLSPVPTAENSATPAFAVQPATVDFAIKAGLFTTSPKLRDAEDNLEDA